MSYISLSLFFWDLQLLMRVIIYKGGGLDLVLKVPICSTKT